MTARVVQDEAGRSGASAFAAERRRLKARYSAQLEEGIENLNRALLLDPQYDDAMAYLDLLIHERRRFAGHEDWNIWPMWRYADAWVQKTLATKKMPCVSCASASSTASSSSVSRRGGDSGAYSGRRDG